MKTTRGIRCQFLVSRRIHSTLAAGAQAYVHQDDTFDRLLEAIQSAIRGQQWLSPRVSGPRDGTAGPTCPELLADRPQQFHAFKGLLHDPETLPSDLADLPAIGGHDHKSQVGQQGERPIHELESARFGHGVVGQDEVEPAGIGGKRPPRLVTEEQATTVWLARERIVEARVTIVGSSSITLMTAPPRVAGIGGCRLPPVEPVLRRTGIAG